MSQQIYTIVITDGAFQGASQHTDRGDAVPINLAELKKVIPKLDGAAVEKLDKIEAKHAAEIAAKESEKDAAIQSARDKAVDAEAALTAIESAIADPSVDDSATIKIAKAEVEKSKLTKKQKELAEIDRQIAELQMKKAEFRDAKKA